MKIENEIESLSHFPKGKENEKKWHTTLNPNNILLKNRIKTKQKNNSYHF